MIKGNPVPLKLDERVGLLTKRVVSHLDFTLYLHCRQQKQQNVNNLAKETDKLMKEFGSLPVTTEQVRHLLYLDINSVKVIFSNSICIIFPTECDGL